MHKLNKYVGLPVRIQSKISKMFAKMKLIFFAVRGINDSKIYIYIYKKRFYQFSVELVIYAMAK